MSQLCERLIVTCPNRDATTRLAEFVRENTRADGHMHLPLRAPISILSMQRTIGERCVVATLSALHASHDSAPTYSVTWEPEGELPFPAFAGALAAHPAPGNRDAVELVLTGYYEPPLAWIGAMFDAALGQTIAHATAHDLLARIAASMDCQASSARPSELTV